MKVNFKKLSKKQIILIAVIAVLLIVLVPSGIYCGIHKETPQQMLTDMFSSKETQIVGKWENQTSPGLSAYEFYEDGSYDNYLSTFSFTGNYTIDGNKLTLSNPNSGGTVLYKVAINGDTMTLTLLDSKGNVDPTDVKNEFARVEHLNMKSITDIFSDMADAKNADSETTQADSNE